MEYLNLTQRKQFNDILELLGESLDITQTQFDNAVRSYNSVGQWLSRPESGLYNYKPEVLAQGSFLLGTMVRSINSNDDIDIDLVCKLIGKRGDWTQFNLKQIIGDELKAHMVYERLLEKPDGRRCWTLSYREDSDSFQDKYHMDVLPSIVDQGYEIVMRKSFDADEDLHNVEELAIRITDRERSDYYSQTSHLEWLKSNPFGYGKWFFQRANQNILTKGLLLSEAVKPVPQYQKKKLPLQRIVQILKRHRDMMFNGDEDKPISIIITTLAAKAYNGEHDVITGLSNVVQNMLNFVGERYSEEHGRIIKWIGNPVNPEENFADRWPEYPLKEENFFKWHAQLRSDLNEFGSRVGSGLYEFQDSISKSFGHEVANETFKNYGLLMRERREEGSLKMARGSGIIGVTSGLPVKDHNFEGNIE